MTDDEALMRFVRTPEGHYRWAKRGTGAAGPEVELSIESQLWRGVVWKHTLRIYFPPEGARSDTALIYIGSDTPAQGAERKLGISLALRTGCVVAFLYDIPNQPLFDGLSEDALIAHSFEQYLDTGDDSWPLLLPMVKSVVRAMDTVQNFCRSLPTPVHRFVLSGLSKRAWTAWLTAAADARVSGIIPMVYDNLDAKRQMANQLETWGAYSDQIKDYTDRNLQERMNSLRGATLSAMVDPVTYAHRITAPRLVILGTNDRYWATGALNLYWDRLPARKWLLYIPNAGHGLDDWGRVFQSAAWFTRQVAAGAALPALQWSFVQVAGHVYVVLSADTPITAARMWAADAPTRDFRAARWTALPLRPGDLEEGAHRKYVGELQRPASGFRACFGEYQFGSGGDAVWFTTQMEFVEAQAK